MTPEIFKALLVELRDDLGLTGLYPTGSVHFFGEGKDYDLLAYIDAPLEDITESMLDKEYTTDGANYPTNSTWNSFRKDEVNVLVHTDKEMYDNMVVASKVCRFLGKNGFLPADNKQLRIDIHQTIVAGRDPEKEHTSTQKQAFWTWPILFTTTTQVPFGQPNY